MNARLRYLSTTLALLAVGVGAAWFQARPVRHAPPPPPRAATAMPPAPAPPLPLTAGQVLERGSAVSLTPDQTVRLEALDRAWRREAAELETGLRVAEDEVSSFMGEAQKAGGASLQEIQRRSAEFRDLSVAFRERRRIHGDKAARLLTESQRRTLSTTTSPVTPGGSR